VDLHHLFSAQAPRKNFAAASVAPAPTIQCSKPAFFKKAAWYLVGYEPEPHPNFCPEPEPEPHQHDVAPQHCLK
jgi:hypothetical protein